MDNLPTWMFELYNEAKEVVYSLVIDENTGENTILHAEKGWRDQFMIDSFFAYDSIEDALSWSGKSMNTYWFIKDIRSAIRFSETSLQSFSNYLEEIEDSSWQRSFYRGLYDTARQIAELKRWYPALELPFRPSGQDLRDLEHYITQEIERQKQDWHWSPDLFIPQPETYYLSSLNELLSDTLKNARAGKLSPEQEVQIAINKVATEWDPLADSFYYDESNEEHVPDRDLDRAKEKLVEHLMLDQEWWGTEAGIRALVNGSKWKNAEHIQGVMANEKFWINDAFRPPLKVFRSLEENFLDVPAPVSKQLALVVNHPDVLKINLEEYYTQHNFIAQEKMERYKSVLETFPPVLEKFEYSSHRERHWIYRVFDKDGQLLYVGETANPLVRLRQHAGLGAAYDHHRRTVSPWFPHMDTIHLEPCDYQALAREKEAEYIRLEKPKFNQIHNKEQESSLTDASGEHLQAPSRNDPRNVGWKGHRHVPLALPTFGRILSETEAREGRVFREEEW